MTDIITDVTELEQHFDAHNATAVAVIRKRLDKYQR